MPMQSLIPTAAASAAARSENTPKTGAKDAFQNVLNRETETSAAQTAEAARTTEAQAATGEPAAPEADTLPVDEARPDPAEEKVPNQDDQIALAAPMVVVPPRTSVQATPNTMVQGEGNTMAQPVEDKAAPSVPRESTAIDNGLRTDLDATASQAPLPHSAPGSQSKVAAMATEKGAAVNGTDGSSAPIPSQGDNTAGTPATNAIGMAKPETGTPPRGQDNPTAALRTATTGTSDTAGTASPEDLGEARFSRLLNYMNAASSAPAAGPVADTATTMADANATATQPAVQISSIAGWRFEPGENNHTFPPKVKPAVMPASDTAATADSAAASELLADGETGLQLPVTAVPAPTELLPEAEKAGDWPQEPEPFAALSAPAGSGETTAPETVRSATAPHASTFTTSEHEVMEQIIQRSSLRELEGKQHLTVELHPQDLGQVKLDLVQENNRLQLHLQAQSGEVCDILQKHLPRLQEALAQQGLRLDTIQVSVDSQGGNAQGFFEQRQQQPRNPRWNSARETSQPAQIQTAAARAAARPNASGLSLRI